MTLARFRTFTVVAKCLNLSKAAEKLRVTQPSVSQQLKLLEQEFGKKLYLKVPQGIKLTYEGQLFSREAEAILARMDELKKKFGAGLHEAETESLVVGGTYAPSAILLPSVLAVFKKNYPRVQVRLLTGPVPENVKKVMEGDLDIAVLCRVDAPPNVTAERYGTTHLVFFAAANYPITNQKELSLSDLAKVPLVLRNLRPAGSTEIVLQQLRDLGFKPNIAMHCDSPEGVKTAVRKKLGVGLLYHDAIRFDLKRDEFKRLKVRGLNLDREIFIIYRQGEALSVHARNFRAILQEFSYK